MPEIPPDDDAPAYEWDFYFRSHGEPKLRMLIATGGWPQHLMLRAIQWLEEQDRAAAAVQIAVQDEGLTIARSTKDAAWASAKTAERAADAAVRSATAAEKANKRATLALVLALASIAATVVGLLLSHWDATHGH